MRGHGEIKMYRKSTIADNFDQSDEDWMAYKEFRHLWEMGTLTKYSTVYRKVDDSSFRICRVYNKPEQAMYVTSLCLSELAKLPFTRGGSLDESIRSIIKREIISLWNFHSDVRAEVAEMEDETRSLEILREVNRKVDNDSLMRETKASRMEIQETIIETVLSGVTIPVSAPVTQDRNSEPETGSVDRRLFHRLIRWLFGKS